MMNGWLIYDKNQAKLNESYIEWFIDEAKRQHIHLKLILREQLQIAIKENKYRITVDDKNYPLPDFVVMRTIDSTLHTYFDQLNIRTFNSRFVAEICNNKALTHLHVHALNVPMVDTCFVKRTAFPDEPPFSYPVVVKDAYGRSGKDVYFVQNKRKWQKVPELIKSDNILVQRTNVQLGKDVRVFVIGNEIIASVLRHNEDDFRANYGLGGNAYIYHLSFAERKMIQKIVDYFRFDLVGIDFLISETGELMFNEIEDVVGSRILSKATNINLLEKYITYIKQSMPFPK